MQKFVKAAKIDEIKAGSYTGVKLEGVLIGIHNIEGKYYAINNICPHVGGILHADGLEDGVVVCPIHQWKFDVTTGKCIWPGKCNLATYPVKVEGEAIFVDVNSPSCASAERNSIRIYHAKTKRR